jgi:hypothetical protein
VREREKSTGRTSRVMTPLTTTHLSNCIYRVTITKMWFYKTRVCDFSVSAIGPMRFMKKHRS